MKILLVNKLYYPWIGGVERVVQQIAEGLQGKDDLEIEVLCCSPRGKRRLKELNGVRVHRASSFGIFWGMPFSLDFFRLFQKLSREVDIIDFHHPFPLADLAIFFFRPKAKLIVHYHSDIVRQRILSFFFRSFIFNTLRKAKKIIVSNPNLIQSSPFLKRFSEKCVVIPFGIDLAKFQNNENNETRPRCINEDGSRWKGKALRLGAERTKEKYGNFVLFVGRLSYYKGLQYLIEAMRGVGANLVIIGEGPERESLKLKVKSLKLEKRVYFLPHQPERELINFYRACQVFVLPSIFKSEAFGLVLAEAMACSKPVISTELGTGTSWVNIDGKTGFVILPRKSQALTQSINKVLQNKKLAQELGQKAEERAKEEFSLEKMLAGTSEIYRKL